MKRLIYTTGICIALTVSCSGNKTNFDMLFISPQPEGAKELRQFPAHLLGNYESEKDNNIINIRSDGIFQNTSYEDKIAVEELDPKHVLIGDSLLKRPGKADLPVRRLGDSLSLQFNGIDTLFFFDKNHIVRKFKKSYILNIRQESGWAISKLETTSNKLLMWSYLDDEEAEQLKKLSESHIDSVPYKFRISASKFKEFMKSNGFQKVDTFKLKDHPRKPFLRFKKS
jgi:hypothetical protein